MSGVGSSELIILLLIGLVVLGPKRLPQIANQLGSWIGQARRMTRAMKRQLEDELNLDENFQPKAPKIAPPVASPAPNSADPAYDYDSSGEPAAPDPEAAPEVEAYIPSDDDTYSPAHDAEDSDDDADEKEKTA